MGEEKHSMAEHNENAIGTNYDVIVEEEDVGSDEDRLRAELNKEDKEVEEA